jgi:antitoxin ParD1/3/4
MKVTLTPQLETLIEERVRSGCCESSSEVVREGLRFFFAQQAPSRPVGFTVSSREQLEAKLLEGIAELDRGDRVPSEAAFQELEHRAQARHSCG